MKADMEFVSTNARVPFRCQKCADCCRHVDDALMLEPLDIFRLAQFFHERDGSIAGPEDVLDRYAHPAMVESLPIFQINTVGDDHECVFLKDGKCIVYDARPQVCRMYPFGTAPGSRGKDFNYYLCTERKHHFGVGSIRVKDWVNENLSKEAKEFYRAEYDLLPMLGKRMRAIGEDRSKRMLFSLLYYLYFGYDPGKPFLPQYKENMAALIKLLEQE